MASRGLSKVLPSLRVREFGGKAPLNCFLFSFFFGLHRVVGKGDSQQCLYALIWDLIFLPPFLSRKASDWGESERR